MRISDWSSDVCSSDLPFQQSLRVGRLQKLGRLGLASHIGGDSWRLGPDLATTLRRMGERGDIIRTMQRQLTARKLARAPVHRVMIAPAAEVAAPTVGRVLTRGLARQHAEPHYLPTQGTDARTPVSQNCIGNTL